MARWLLKAAIQGALSVLPGGPSLYRTLHRVPLPNDRFERKIGQCRRHLENYLATTQGMPAAVIELGTGWHPLVPIGLYLCGASPIYTFDKIPNLSARTLRETIQRFVDYLTRGELGRLLPWLDEERARNLVRAVDLCNGGSSPGEVLKALDIAYRVQDARSTDLEPGSIDLFVSNNTLEHIPGDTILGLFQEFRRLSRRGAVMSHSIDMSDHYAHFDGTITSINYMQYSEGAWRVFNNALQYQNRLLISDYRQIHDRAGFEIVSEEHTTCSPEVLDKVHLAARFQGYPREEILIRNSWIVSIRADSRPNGS